MSKLEELRDLVAKAFEKAETKENIETLATINNKIDEVSHENTYWYMIPQKYSRNNI